MLAGLRRLAVLLVATAVGLGGVAALGGLAFGSSAGRSISVTYYVVGAFLLVLGFFAGTRGPLRPRGSEEASDPVTGMFGVGISSKGARTATETERKDSIATAGIFLAVGIWLIALGVVIDGSASIV
jgi:hypothetical protein